MRKNKWLDLLIFLGFIILALVLFYKIIGGYSFLGVDSNYSIRRFYQIYLNAGISQYYYNFQWIGFSGPSPLANLYTLCLYLFPLRNMEVFALLSSTLSLLFAYLLFRRWKLSKIASIFGAIAFAFTPHIITLFRDAHSGTIDMWMYVPLILLSIDIILSETKNKWKNLLFILIGGIAWGIMLSSDPQRGLYFSVFNAAYILYLLFKNHKVKIKTFFKDIATRPFLTDIAKILVIAVFLFLAFFNGIQSWIGGEVLEGEQAGVTETDESKWQFATSWSMHPTELIGTVAFGYLGLVSGDEERPYWGYLEYRGNSVALGFFVFIFMLLGTVAYYKKDSRVRFFFWGGIIALLLAMGRYIPGSPLFWLWYQIPLMDKFRAPVKFHTVTAFAFAILAAFGMQFFIDLFKAENRDATKTLKTIRKAILIGFGAGLVWLFAVLLANQSIASSFSNQFGNVAGRKMANNMINALLRMNIFIGLTLGIVVLTEKLRTHKNALLICVTPFILLMIFDLFSINYFYLNKAYFKPDDIFYKDAVLQTIEQDPEIHRVITSLKFINNGQMVPLPVTGIRGHFLTYIFPYYGIEALDVTAVSRLDPEYNKFFTGTLIGSITAPLTDITQIIDINIRLMRLANVKYLITDGGLYGFQQPVGIYETLDNHPDFELENIVHSYYDRQHAIFRLKDPLPRVGFYSAFLAVTDNETALEYISFPDFDINEMAVVYGDYSDKPEIVSPVQKVDIVEYKPWYVKAEFDAPTDGLVLHTTKHDPAWNVYVNGEKRELLKANYIMQGVFVDSGKNVVEFKFEPDNKPFLISLFTVLFGLGLTAAYGIFSLIRFLKNKEKASS
jgi:hypothetical protein